MPSSAVVVLVWVVGSKCWARTAAIENAGYVAGPHRDARVPELIDELVSAGFCDKTQDDVTCEPVTMPPAAVERDPAFSAHAASNVTNARLSNLDQAFSWGDHRSAGYLTAAPERVGALAPGKWCRESQGKVACDQEAPLASLPSSMSLTALSVAGGLSVGGFTSLGSSVSIAGPDLWFAATDRGDGGRALVHGANDQLIINYAGDFFGGTYIAGNAKVEGELDSGNIKTPGRLHIMAGEKTFLLGTEGVIVSRAWGGNRQLTVDDDVFVGDDLVVGFWLKLTRAAQAPGDGEGRTKLACWTTDGRLGRCDDASFNGGTLCKCQTY